jgi:hypothetical protein
MRSSVGAALAGVAVVLAGCGVFPGRVRNELQDAARRVREAGHPGC